ncbi:MAG: hypothetical protein AB8I08_10435 [Sandaracinaceae bacterium]
MGYRDETAVLRERIDQLELSLAKTTGRAMLFEDERDALSRRLDALTGDPRALARARSRNKLSKLPFRAMRVAGALMLVAGVLPMALMALALMFNEPAAGLMCSIVPALIVLGTMALKMPEVVTWIQVREEKKRAETEAATLYRARARVDLSPSEHALEVSDEVEEASDRMRR